jgi:hypothetical protein
LAAVRPARPRFRRRSSDIDPPAPFRIEGSAVAVRHGLTDQRRNRRCVEIRCAGEPDMSVLRSASEKNVRRIVEPGPFHEPEIDPPGVKRDADHRV